MADPAALFPTLLLAVPIAGGCVLVALGARLPRWAVDGTAALVVAVQVALAVLLVRATGSGRVVDWVAGWQPRPGETVGIVLVADRTGAELVLLIAVLTGCALLFSWRYFDSVHGHFHALVLLFTVGMTGFVLTGDLFDMFVFFELMGAAGYALAGFKIEEPRSVQGALNFGVVNSLGAYLCLIGIGLLYARTGALGLAQLGTALAGKPADPLVVAAFVLIGTGWLVKAAAAPFHFWLADAHAVAPSPVCVLFSGVMAPLGVYGIARVYHVVFAGVLPDAAAHRAFLVLGVLTAVVGTVMCTTQRHIKRLLAYSTIAHIGLFLLGLSTLDSSGIAATGLYLAGHAGVKGALFLLTGILLDRHDSVDEHELHGAARAHRPTGVLFLLAGLALAGLPPFGIGLGKALLEESGGPWATVLVVAVSAVTGGAVLRVGLRVYFGLGPTPGESDQPDTMTGRNEEPDVSERCRTPATMVAAIVILLVGAFALGVLPAAARAIGEGAAAFTDRAGYLAQTLHAATAPLPAAPETGWTADGVLLGFGSAALAALLAFAAVYAPQLPARSRTPVARAVRPALHELHRLHSGHIGDYAAWLLAGTTLLAALVAF